MVCGNRRDMCEWKLKNGELCPYKPGKTRCGYHKERQEQQNTIQNEIEMVMQQLRSLTLEVGALRETNVESNKNKEVYLHEINSIRIEMDRIRSFMVILQMKIPQFKAEQQVGNTNDENSGTESNNSHQYSPILSSSSLATATALHQNRNISPVFLNFPKTRTGWGSR